MSLLSEMVKKPGKSKRRLGRGRGSNWGGTSGKGHKGQHARSGCSLKPNFEGGQLPMIRRLPKVGFKNVPFKTRYQIVNLKDLERFKGDEVSPQALAKLGFIASPKKLVKILGQGQLKKSLKVSAHKFSESAKLGIEKSGGSVSVIAPKQDSKTQKSSKES